jgi:glutamyl-tRNA reductase
VMQRLLHEPTIRLRSLDREGAHGRMQIARELFGLEEGVDTAGAEPAQDAEADVRPLRRRDARP